MKTQEDIKRAATENGNKPASAFLHEFKGGWTSSEGLTKREMIAAMVLQGICANSAAYERMYTGEITDSCIHLADALLLKLEEVNR